MKYKALIFDMDGTLVHNMPFHNRALEETLTEAGVQLPDDMTVLYNSIYGKKTLEVFRILLGPHLTDSEVSYWSERKETLYRRQYASHREPLPGLLQGLEQAHSMNLPMAIASASSPENISFILDDLDLRRHFKAVVSGHDIQHGKPNPEIFLKSAEAMGVKPSECLVFEDALNGVEAASRAGMDAVFLSTTIEAQKVNGLSHVLQVMPDFTHLDLPKLMDQSENSQAHSTRE